VVCGGEGKGGGRTRVWTPNLLAITLFARVSGGGGMTASLVRPGKF
jgi:hypothetical protein